MPSYALDAWLRPLVVQADGEGLRLGCPSPFHSARVRDRYLAAIARCAGEEAGRDVPVSLCVVSGTAPTSAPPPVAVDAQPAPRGVSKAPAVRRPAQRAFPYTFDSFVVGPCNALAREASFAVAQARQRGLNPLFLSSASGLGKTHLARAIVAEAGQSGCESGLYASAESFTGEFMTAIRTKQMDRFKRRYRTSCGLLVLEDVEFLRSKSATQLELFHTLTHLLDAGVRVVFTGDRLPRDIPGLEPRLRSQLSAGLVAELEAPDARVRREILRSKSAAGGVRLPEDCLDLLVEAVRGSVRDLEGVLIQLVSTASLLKRPIDLELTSAALHKLEPRRDAPKLLEPEQVSAVVAVFFGLAPEALASRSRRRDVLVPRQLAMYLCRRYTDRPLSAIARAFGREHPAVSNAIKVVERRILERAPLRYQVEELSARLDKLAHRARRGEARTRSGV